MTTNDELCDRCARVMEARDLDLETATVHVATYGSTTEPFALGDGEVIPAGSFYHGDSWYRLCPECTAAWRQWFALFIDRGREW